MKIFLVFWFLLIGILDHNTVQTQLNGDLFGSLVNIGKKIGDVAKEVVSVLPSAPTLAPVLPDAPTLVPVPPTPPTLAPPLKTEKPVTIPGLILNLGPNAIRRNRTMRSGTTSVSMHFNLLALPTFVALQQIGV